MRNDRGPPSVSEYKCWPAQLNDEPHWLPPGSGLSRHELDFAQIWSAITEVSFYPVSSWFPIVFSRFSMR